MSQTKQSPSTTTQLPDPAPIAWPFGAVTGSHGVFDPADGIKVNVNSGPQADFTRANSVRFFIADKPDSTGVGQTITLVKLQGGFASTATNISHVFTGLTPGKLYFVYADANVD